MRVIIIGAGVVGTATGKLLESVGHGVTYHDPPKGIIGDPAGCVVALLCVPTPMQADGYCSTEYILEAADWLFDADFFGLVGIRSTVPPGTCASMKETFPGWVWFSWPEFLRDAHAEMDVFSPVRRVLGLPESRAGVLRAFCESLPRLPDYRPLLITTPTAAEFVKYATNAIHATNVGLANELAELALTYGVDWNDNMPVLARFDQMLPDNIVVSERGGFGGKCLPKDVAALVRTACAHGTETPILAAVDAENRRRRPEEYQLPGEANA